MPEIAPQSAPKMSSSAKPNPKLTCAPKKLKITKNRAVEIAPIKQPFIKPMPPLTQNEQPKNTERTFINWFTDLTTPLSKRANFMINANIKTLASVTIIDVKTPFVISPKKDVFSFFCMKKPPNTVCLTVC
jgi:hypothetical protein